VTFVSAAAEEAGLRQRLGTRRRLIPVRGTRQVTRASLLASTAVPPVEVDPSDGTVRPEDRTLRAAPVSEVTLSRRYLLG
jgi:urease subunit alpha